MLLYLSSTNSKLHIVVKMFSRKSASSCSVDYVCKIVSKPTYYFSMLGPWPVKYWKASLTKTWYKRLLDKRYDTKKKKLRICLLSELTFWKVVHQNDARKVLVGLQNRFCVLLVKLVLKKRTQNRQTLLSFVQCALHRKSFRTASV